MKQKQENLLQNQKESLQIQFNKKMEEKDNYYNEEIEKLTQKYESKILELYKMNESLDVEYSKMKSDLYIYPSKLNEMELENNRLQVIINNLKVENESLFNSLNQKKYENISTYADKIQTKKDLGKKSNNALSTVMNMILKLKIKYTEEINKLRFDIENLSVQHENETYNLKNTVQSLEKVIFDEREFTTKLKNDFEIREEEFLNISKELDKLRTMYETKVDLLQRKIIDLKADNRSMKEKYNIKKDKQEESKEQFNKNTKSKYGYKHDEDIKALMKQLNLEGDAK